MIGQLCISINDKVKLWKNTKRNFYQIFSEAAFAILGMFMQITDTAEYIRCSLLVLSLYLDEGRGVQGNTSMRSREFPRAQPEGTPETECWYFPVLPDSSQGTDIIQLVKVMKL